MYISAGHDATADAAQIILQAGGNAFDAAIAALFTAFVAEPCMASGGGGGFANIYTADHQLIIYDFFCQTPKRKRIVNEVEFFPVHLDFGEKKETYHIGKGSTGTPGTIAGIFALHQSLGSIPMKYLVEPAIKAAKEGVAINQFQHQDMVLLQEILGQKETGRNIFFDGDNIKDIGELTYMSGLADFLDYLAGEGRDAFYQGEIAHKIVNEYESGGGYLTLEDLRDYQVIQRKGLSIPFRGYEVITNPLPAFGGALLALSLNGLKTIPENQNHLEESHIQMWYETLAKFSESEKNKSIIPSLLNRAGIPFDHPTKRGSTTHFNIVDKWNNAISLTTTVGEGCGYFIEGTDMQMNNMLGEASLVPEGFHNWKTDVRLSTMMSPTVVLDKEKKLWATIGSGGASRIPYAIAQVLSHIIDYQLRPEVAVNAPRVHLENGVFNVEHGFEATFDESLIKEELKQWQSSSMFFGGVNAIVRQNGKWIPAADERRFGVIRSA